MEKKVEANTKSELFVISELEIIKSCRTDAEAEIKQENNTKRNESQKQAKVRFSLTLNTPPSNGLTTRTWTTSTPVDDSSIPRWFSNYSIRQDQTNINDVLAEIQVEEQEEHNQNVIRKRVIIYYWILLPSVYLTLCGTIFMNTTSAYHMMAWCAIFATVTLIVFYVNIFLFTRNICFFEANYKCINGTIYVPDGIIKDYGRSFDSISMFSHVRGTTINKWHTLIVNIGSFSVFFGAIMKLFDLKCNNFQQEIAVYLLLLTGVGGIVMGNVEAHSSPSYSAKHNLIKGYIHLYGVFCHVLFGPVSFVVYTNMHWFPVALFGLTLTLLLLYKRVARCIYKHDLGGVQKVSTNYLKLTNRRSKINMIMEITAILPSAIAMCALLYHFGNEPIPDC